MVQPDIPYRLAAMRQLAAAKVAAAAGSPAFWREVESHLEVIAHASLAGMAPINENLLGIAMMLLAETKRLLLGASGSNCTITRFSSGQRGGESARINNEP